MLWWCDSHNRRATFVLRREGESPEAHCDPKLGGILLPCKCRLLDWKKFVAIPPKGAK